MPEEWLSISSVIREYPFDRRIKDLNVFIPHGLDKIGLRHKKQTPRQIFLFSFIVRPLLYIILYSQTCMLSGDLFSCKLNEIVNVFMCILYAMVSHSPEWLFPATVA